MQKSIFSILLSLAASAVLTSQAAPADTSARTAPASDPAVKSSNQSPNSVIAKGKGVEIKRSQLDDAVLEVKANAAAQGQTVPPEQMAMLEPRVLDRLIQSQILLSKATDADKAKAREEATRNLQQAKTNAPSEEAFNARLKAIGTSQEKIVKNLTEQGTAEAVLLRELKINVTESDAKKFYDDTNNASHFNQPEMVRASHILLMTQDPRTSQELSSAEKAAKHKTMEGLLKRARAGEDFAKLAKEFSEDPGSKDKGGEYTFPRGEMMPEFEAAAFALKTNEVSDIVTTSYGYHIIKLSEHIPAQKVAFEKVAPRIKEHLTQKELAALAPEYLAKARKDANVEILDEKLKQPDSLPAIHPAAKGDPASNGSR